MTWLIYALLSAFTAASVTIFAKAGVGKLDTTLATTIRTIIMAFMLFGISVATKKFSHFSFTSLEGKEISFLVLSAIAGALSLLFYFQALKMGDAGKVAVIDRLSLVFIAVFSVALFKEKIDLGGVIGLVFVAIGAMLVSLK